jgi:hypothetical protein
MRCTGSKTGANGGYKPVLLLCFPLVIIFIVCTPTSLILFTVTKKNGSFVLLFTMRLACSILLEFLARHDMLQDARAQIVLE